MGAKGEVEEVRSGCEVSVSVSVSVVVFASGFGVGVEFVGLELELESVGGGSQEAMRRWDWARVMAKRALCMSGVGGMMGAMRWSGGGEGMGGLGSGCEV